MTLKKGVRMGRLGIDDDGDEEGPQAMSCVEGGGLGEANVILVIIFE